MGRTRTIGLLVAIALAVLAGVLATRHLQTPGLQRWSCGTALQPLYLEADGGFPRGKDFKSCHEVVDRQRAAAGLTLAAAAVLGVGVLRLPRRRPVGGVATFAD